MRKTMLIALLLLLAGTLAMATGTQEPGSAETGEPVTIRQWDWGDSFEAYTRERIAIFEEKNPNVDIEYSLFTVDQFAQNIQLAVRSEDVPDVFPRPGSISFFGALDDEWFQPLDPLVEEVWPGGLDAFVDGFPETSFVEGINVWDGDIYHAPTKFPAGSGVLLFYNKDLMEQAGLDPNQPPDTWGELREHARLITEAADGDAYGIIMGGNQLRRWDNVITALAQTIGPYGGAPYGGEYYAGLNYTNGRYEFEAPAFVRAMGLLTDMRDDGSYYPGFLSLNAPQARALFGLGEVGFMFQGQWNIAVWQRDNPDLNFGVTFVPVPDEGRSGYVHNVPVAAAGEPFGIARTTEHPILAARVLLDRYTREWMDGYAKTGDGFAVYPDSNSPENLNEMMQQVFTYSLEQRRVAPDPLVRDSAAVGAVYSEIVPPTPGLQEIVQGAFSGALEYEEAAAVLSAKWNAELDRAIAAVQAEGIDVSRDLWVFDWDGTTNWSGD